MASDKRPEKVQLNVEVDRRTVDLAKKAAKREDRSLASFVRVALRNEAQRLGVAS